METLKTIVLYTLSFFGIVGIGCVIIGIRAVKKNDNLRKEYDEQ
ncbi:hypothetical protein [Mucilaginibacter sp. 10I4]|nr:hypothetical protein [Mucilaginibacter sp. 10I4]MEB0262895.1 hypothetical protein [Mucilaginibacter sp. 10I4]